ncbi:hypothetical protein Taro_004478 [Colocasia esculenta]|uniref:Uncharacterized protein n=1 Tax=Colocasia esculenta TaxID=4460 RepID=A0A843TI89_COLES|nr:hypothetical protein [Colocasia esculenta]
MNKLEQAEKDHKGKAEDLTKFVNGKQNLDAILGSNIFVAKHGIGYQPVKQKKMGETLITSFVNSSSSTSYQVPSKNKKGQAKGKKQEPKKISSTVNTSKKSVNSPKEGCRQVWKHASKEKLTRQQNVPHRFH